MRWRQHIEAETNGRHFADAIFKCIFLNENVWIPIKISLKFVPKVPINNIPALVQILAWRRSGDKPLSEPMMVSVLTHICVTRLQWVKHAQVSHYIKHRWPISLANKYKDASRFWPSQWETALLCKDVSRWLKINLESALKYAFDRQVVLGLQQIVTPISYFDPIDWWVWLLILPKHINNKTNHFHNVTYIVWGTFR